jgi:hypothetical protein
LVKSAPDRFIHVSLDKVILFRPKKKSSNPIGFNPNLEFFTNWPTTLRNTDRWKIEPYLAGIGFPEKVSGSINLLVSWCRITNEPICLDKYVLHALVSYVASLGPAA